MKLTIYLEISFFAICFFGWGITDVSAQSPSELFHPFRLEVSLNTSNTNLDLPDWQMFQDQESSPSQLLPETLEEFSVDDTFPASSAYAGLMINFLFDSKWFGKAELRKHFFSLGFEAGQTTREMYRLSLTDTTVLAYTSAANQFRITVGYRRMLYKRDRRLRLYSGLEFISEVNISSILWERLWDTDFDETVSERKMFAKQAYSPYVNVPFGLEVRLTKKSVFLIHLNLGIGSQFIDPFRLTNFYAGLRMGLSFQI